MYTNHKYNGEFEMKNFYPEQYRQTQSLPVNHNYLVEQFSDHDEIFAKIANVVERGDFTLGEAVDRFENKFAALTGAKYAIGVGSGTDGLFLSLRALNIGSGDEVIVPTFTFYATVGAIVTAGATPVFVDSDKDYNIDPKKIEALITPKTKAIMPVHWSGKICMMDEIMKIANKYNLHIVEDACHAITSHYKGRKAGSFGTAACFSMHPLKNLNVWGDGGIIVTNSDRLSNKLRLMRNHGLASRDICAEFGYNSRLDTIQAVVAEHMLSKLDSLIEKRIKNAAYLDAHLGQINGVTIPRRDSEISRQVFHIYPLIYSRRDELKLFLEEKGIDAKIHYPVPMHLQPAAAYLNKKAGDFPVAEYHAKTTLSLPVHEFINKDQLDHMISAIQEFYK